MGWLTKYICIIQPVHSEGDQPWDFFGRKDAKAETPDLSLVLLMSFIAKQNVIDLVSNSESNTAFSGHVFFLSPIYDSSSGFFVFHDQGCLRAIGFCMVFLNSDFSNISSRLDVS